MKVLFLIIATLCFSSAMADDFDSDRIVTCAHGCNQRHISGSCLFYGEDYCGHGEGVACVAHCVQRTINLMCTNYSRDYCGIYPECTPHCLQVSVQGTCLRYGADQCFSQTE